MKKILALLMMFLIAGNFVFAQVDGTTGTEGEATATVSVQPKLNFQAVVRDADNKLVFEKEMTVVINITSGDAVAYSETHTGVMTNMNGLLTVIIGGGDATEVNGTLSQVDWSNASIEALLTFRPDPIVNEDNTTTEQEMTTITVTSEVTAVPYALQAGSTTLNTDMIVDYISGIKLGTNGSDVEKRDVLLILDAIRNNEQGLKEDLKDTIVEYMKTRMDIAREIFHYYLQHVDSADVWNTYEQLMANPTAKEQVRNVIIHFIKTHKADALEVLEYYAEHVTVADLQDLYDQFDHNETLKSAVRAVVANELEGYLTLNHYVSNKDCEGVEICDLANASKPCPSSSDAFIGATTLVSNKLQTTITNPDNLALSATYNITYTVDGDSQTVTFAGTKDGNNLIIGANEIPAGATVTGSITIHVYNCETDFVKNFNF